MKKIFALVLIAQSFADVNGQSLHKVYPNKTDSNINTFTSSYHYCYAPTVAKNKLLIFLPGSGAQPSGCQEWMTTGQEQGFHVIGISYPNEKDLYDKLADWKWINEYAYEKIFGVDKSPATDVNYSNCIENRIIKCLQWLQRNYPSEGWGQFLNGDSLLYSKCIFSAFSIGGTFAACIGKFRKVERVICVSSPRLVTGRDWGTFATPLNKFYFFWHDLDKPGSRIDQYTILEGMGITGPLVIEEQTNPSSWGHVLKTVYKCPPSAAHKIVIIDAVTPIVDGVPYYKKVWIHLMTN